MKKNIGVGITEEEDMKKKRFGGVLPKIILIAIVIYAVASIVALQGKMKDAEQQRRELEAKVEAQALENAELEDDISRKDDPDKIAELARDNFGLVDSGEIVFFDIGG